jgi:hypothetical protein
MPPCLETVHFVFVALFAHLGAVDQMRLRRASRAFATAYAFYQQRCAPRARVLEQTSDLGDLTPLSWRVVQHTRVAMNRFGGVLRFVDETTDDANAQCFFREVANLRFLRAMNTRLHLLPPVTPCRLWIAPPTPICFQPDGKTCNCPSLLFLAVRFGMECEAEFLLVASRWPVNLCNAACAACDGEAQCTKHLVPLFAVHSGTSPRLLRLMLGLGACWWKPMGLWKKTAAAHIAGCGSPALVHALREGVHDSPLLDALLGTQ